jgi:hypothetical protein
MDDHDRIVVAAQLAAALIASSSTPGPVAGVTDEEWVVNIFQRIYTAIPAAPGLNLPPTP